MRAQIVVIAKEPVAGKVKTRLCPPCTPQQAAMIAQAALDDTLAAATATPAVGRVLLLDGGSPRPPGWDVVAQRGDGLAQRLANGLSDTAIDGIATLLIGMDTPQVTPLLLQDVIAGLDQADVVLGAAEDGGWWALALRDPATGMALAAVPMSQPDTGELTAKAFTGQGLCVAAAPVLRDVDTIADLYEVAQLCPGRRFATAVQTMKLR